MKSVVKNAFDSLKIKPVASVPPTVDFPVQNETICSSHYTIRVSASEKAESVDVSIDQGTWQACRKAEGFWWYDWSDFDNGEHEVIARTPGKGGRYQIAVPVEFMVERPS